MFFRKLSKSIINSMPIVAFLVIYLISDMFGALVLFHKLEPFYSVFVYHSGISLPVVLSDDQMLTYWLVALGAPLIMSVAFFAVFLRFKKRSADFDPDQRDYDPPFPAVVTFFVILSALGTYSIHRGGGFEALGTWGNYADLVETRWRLYATLSFFEFVNLYQFIPVAAIVALLVGIKYRGWARIIGIVCVIAGVCVGIAIFQKKVVVTTMILTISAVVIYSFFVDPKRIGRIIGFTVVSLLALLAVFFVAAVVPTLSGQKSAIGNSANTTQELDFVEKWRELAAQATLNPDRWSDLTEEERAALSRLTPKEREALRQKVMAAASKAAAQNRYINDPVFVALNNLTMRSSVPAVYYMAVFPDLHPYFPLDLGQDILGFGAMPNDNLIIWNQMYPDMPGVVAAPFNFVLYSQGGLFVTFAMSAVVGMIIGFFWAVVLRSRGTMALRAALGSVIVVGTMHLALDALRNTIIVSYGFAWALFPLMVLLIAGMLSGWRRQTGTGAIAHAE